MKLRIWRLERQKKCLVWQKKYLQAVLQNVENEGNGIEQCRNNRLLEIIWLNILSYRIVASTNTCYYSENQIFYSLE